jgi:hypothetical protein
MKHRRLLENNFCLFQHLDGFEQVLVLGNDSLDPDFPIRRELPETTSVAVDDSSPSQARAEPGSRPSARAQRGSKHSESLELGEHAPTIGASSDANDSDVCEQCAAAYTGRTQQVADDEKGCDGR